MSKANVSRQALVEAIAVLESQRGLIGDRRPLDQAVETALLALRQKLAELQATPGDQKQHQLAVLVADLSGFTALSEHMDVENVRDAINAMWRVLDAVIQAWGGLIEQHAGDSLLALFGLPVPRRGDSLRALQAGLAMQQELALFNDRVRRAADSANNPLWALDWPGPSIRIGIDSGPVYFARGTRATAVGETVANARRLEESAPEGNVLASASVYRESRNAFHMTPLQATPSSGRGGEVAYLVTGERPVPAAFSPDVAAGQETRLVGRVEELERLQLLLQAVIESAAPHIIVLSGPHGGGKSRLIHEFENQARLLAGPLNLLHADTRAADADAPYALIRDVLRRRFGIRPQHSRYLIEHRVRRGLAELDRGRHLLTLPGDRSPESILDMLMQLLDARAAAPLSLETLQPVVEQLFRALAQTGPVIVTLEEAGNADQPSLELVDRLARGGLNAPVLFIATVTSDPSPHALFSIPWLNTEPDVFSSVTRLDVPLLNPVESRQMAAQILNQLMPSMRLLDGIVAGSGGNPLYIETVVQFLIEKGAITAGEQWRADLALVESMAPPSGLPALMAARLAQLPEIERTVLQLASVMGRVFWDTALIDLMPPGAYTAPEVEAALLSLEMRRFIGRESVHAFGATEAYVIRRDSMQAAAYAMWAGPERRAQHLRFAQWLIAKRDESGPNSWLFLDSLVARQLDAAGNLGQAAAWRQRGNRAGVRD